MKHIPATNIISRSYMTGLILKCGLFFGAGLILTGIILFFSAHQPLGPSYQESFARLANLKQEMLIKSMITYLILTSIIIVGVIFITVLYSHRVVGPLVGLKRIIGQINDGDINSPAVLREKDAIKPMADALNAMMESYKKRVTTIQQMTVNMQKTLDKPTEEQQKEFKDNTQAIQEITGQLKL